MTGVVCALGLGSNMGDMAANLRAALITLDSHEKIKVLSASSLYKTPPWGETEQPWFLNAACLIHTSLAPLDLLRVLKSTEQKIGRQARYRWGPREIDLDILNYGDLQMTHEALTLPHAQLFNRGFVLIPLAEIAPDRHIAGRSILAESATCDSTGIEKMHSFWP